jgi:dolichol kinase
MFYILCQYPIINIFQSILGQMALNVLAVCDGFAARIGKPLGLQGCKTVAEFWRGNGYAMT